MSESFDLVVMGGGPAGVAAAIRGVQLGAKVALIESDSWGGLCLNRACVPTKLLMASHDRLQAMRTAAKMGFAGVAGGIDPAGLFDQKNQLVGYFSMGTKGLAGAKGVKLFEGFGSINGLGEVVVGDKVLLCKSIIVATGSKWARPAMPGGDLPGVINSSEFLAEEIIPENTLILGDGPWGMELGQFLAAAGGKATVACPGRNILPAEDQEITQRLRSIINVEPLRILNSCQVKTLEPAGKRVAAVMSVKGEDSIEVFDRVIYFDREPAYDGLGLDTIGIKDLAVDKHLATIAKGVYAVGDVTGQGPALSHRASSLGIIAAENALGGKREFKERAIPRGVYTYPQVASVGLTEEQAEDLDYEVVTGSATLGVSPMAMIQNASNGVIKVVGDEQYGELLGVHILAPNATEIIGAAVMAIQLEATIWDLANCILPHPTISESLADAAREALGWAIYIP